MACPTPMKHGYRDEAVARRHAEGLRGRTRDFAVRAYRCPCGLWHVGHSPDSLRKRLERRGRAS